MNDFHFHECPFVNSPCPRPEDNPMRHLLPPEAPFTRTYTKENHHSVSFEDRNNSIQYVDVTLGNSPEFPSGSQPPRRTKNISYFNNKMGESVNRNIAIDSHEAMEKSKARQSNSPASPAKELNSTVTRNEVYYPYGITQSKSSRVEESRFSRSNTSPERMKDSYVRHCYKCSPHQEERESTCGIKNCPKCNQKEVVQSHYANCYKCKQKEDSSPKAKLTHRSSKEKQLASDIKILTEKMAEVKTRMLELEKANRNLNTQLQNSREKLKAREAEITVLKNKNNDLTIVVGDLTQQRQYHLHIHDEVHQLRNINQSLLIEIEELKKKVVYHESKNTESLRLLQQLNDNISKREEILKKELDEQIIISNRYLEEKNRITIQLSSLTQRLRELEGCHGGLQKIIEDQKLEIYQLRQKIGDNKESVLQATIDELRRQINRLETQLKQSEKKYNITLNEMKSKEEEYAKLQLYSDQLRREKSDTFLRIEEEKTRISSGYDESLRELKNQLRQKDTEMEKLLYRNKELETNWKVLNETNYSLGEELKEVKEEKYIIMKEKEEVRHDSQQLLSTVEKLKLKIEEGSRKEIELNSIIANYQKDILQIEETIAQSLNDISNRDIEIKKWKELYEFEKSKTQKLSYQIKEKMQVIVNLEESLKKESKVVLLYKEGLARLQEKKEVEWTNMNKVYIQQIRRLEDTVKELMDYNENRRNQKVTVYKTNYVEELNHLDKHRIATSTQESREKVERVIPLTTSEAEFREYSGSPFINNHSETITIESRQLPTISETTEIVTKHHPTVTFTHEDH